LKCVEGVEHLRRLLLVVVFASACADEPATDIPADELTQGISADSDGDGLEDAVDLDDDNDGVLDQVECPAATLAGRGFTVRFLANGGWDAGGHELRIAGEPGTLVAIGDAEPVTIGPSGVLTHDAPAVPPTVEVVEVGRALRVTASRAVTVTGRNHEPYSTDAFAVLPDELLGTEYVAIGRDDATSPSQLGVTAIADDTTVVIGELPPITLMRGESYTHERLGDLTGVRVTASAPVAVSVATACLYTGAGACDHAEQALLPISAWSSAYHIPSLPQPQEHRVVAATDGTVVAVDGVEVATLAAGQVYVGAGGGQLVTTSAPSQAYVVALGEDAEGAVGDPAFVLLPGAANAVTRASFSTPATGAAHVVVVSLPVGQTASLRLDGAALGASWVVDAGGSLAQALVPVGAGAHVLTAAAPFTAVVWGEAAYEGYGYPIGLTAPAPAAVCRRDSNDDGLVDSLDLDSDGDGVDDVEEAGGVDADEDGMADGAIDVTGVPGSATGGLTPSDRDGDGVPDTADPDGV
jgi:hypothetical protein